MRYITKEQFEEQPKEIQQVFLDWWWPHSCDLICNKHYGIGILGKEDLLELGRNSHSEFKKENLPLFTLQQLWEFIEDKVNCFLTVDFITDEYWINTDGWWNQKEKCFYDVDKLQAFWKCACEVARIIK